MNKKSGFDFATHVRVGARIRVAREELQAAAIEVANAYPMRGVVGREALRVLTAVGAGGHGAVNKLRCALDDILHRDFPDEEGLGRVYYGSDGR